MKELWTTLLQTLGQAWWVEISTENPSCTYYFGPFSSDAEAESERGGYVEDLEKEGAQGIRVAIKRCKPSQLTIGDDMGNGHRPARTFSQRLV